MITKFLPNTNPALHPSLEALGIKSDDVILDIGPSGQPFEAARWVVDLKDDLMRSPEKQNTENVRKSDYFIFGRGEQLPLKDKSIDFVFCHQVLEHTLEPFTFASEMCRVGKRGFCSVPHSLYEWICPFDYHVSIFFEINGEVYCRPKTKKEHQLFGKFFHELADEVDDWHYVFGKNMWFYHLEWLWEDSFSLKPCKSLDFYGNLWKAKAA